MSSLVRETLGDEAYGEIVEDSKRFALSCLKYSYGIRESQISSYDSIILNRFIVQVIEEGQPEIVEGVKVRKSDWANHGIEAAARFVEYCFPLDHMDLGRKVYSTDKKGIETKYYGMCFLRTPELKEYVKKNIGFWRSEREML